MMYHYDPKVKALVAKDDRDIEVMEAHLEEGDRRKPKASQPKASCQRLCPPARRRKSRRPMAHPRAGPGPIDGQTAASEDAAGESAAKSAPAKAGWRARRWKN